ncbi:MAG: diguanylate cyclase domain-containing protein [Pseudomonadota bacterium]
MEQLAIPHPPSEAADVVTVSIGVSTVVPGAANSPSTLFDSADKMPCQAKQNGRNCVEFSGPRRTASEDGTV